MFSSMLDYSSLEKALRQLEKSINYTHSPLAKEDLEIAEQFQLAAIQAFEYSYELCIKMIRRKLEEMADSAESVDHLGFRDLIRTAAEKGLISDPNLWFEYRERRNITSHTYNREKADDVYKIVEDFLTHAQILLAQLTSTQNAS